MPSRSHLTVTRFAATLALFCASLLLIAAVPALAKPRTTNLRTVQAPSIADPFLFTPAVKPPPYREGELIVRFKRGASEAVRATAHSRRGAKALRKLSLADAVLVSIDPKRNVKTVAHAYSRDSSVAYAEPNFVYTLANYYPTAENVSQLWALDNTAQRVNGVTGTSDADMDVVEAWKKTRGDNGIVVGVVDSGVDYNHVDLGGNMWQNNGETGGTRSTNGIDDDQNGRIDDYRGYDFVSTDNNPTDPIGHGTAVASTIGAEGTSTRLQGVSPLIRLAALRTCDQTGFCDVADIAEAFDYAGDHGMKAVSAALSGPNFSQLVLDEINAHPQTLYIVSAGNGGGDGASDNVDSPGSEEYPCTLTPANVLCIAATDQNDELTGFSNYGSVSVDAAAPGVNVLTAWPGNRVAFQNGTSVATGHAAGAAALVWSGSLTQTAGAVKARLLDNADDKVGLSGRVVSDGRLNVAAALPPAVTSQHGTLDAGFDGDGRQTANFLGCQEAFDLTLQRDGKSIVVGETSPCGADRDFAVARFNGDGSLDTTFDGDGKVVTDIATDSEDYAYSVAVDSGTGKLIVAGYSSGQLAAVRYNQNGSLDTSFDGDGKARFDIGTGNEAAQDVLVDSGGKIVVVGYRGFAFDQNFAVGRLNDNGSFDVTFNGGSWVSTDFANGFMIGTGQVGNADIALGVEQQPDGAYVVAGAGGGFQQGTSLGHNFELARYNTNGSLDTTFDGDGKVITDFASLDEARGLALDPGGTPDIVAAGYTNQGEGGQIAFTSDRDGNSEIYRINALGTGSTNLTTNSALDADPSWNPDGRSIAFTSSRDGNEEIYSMAPNGTGLFRRTNNAGNDNQPSWSPDGVGLVWVSNRDGNSEIYSSYGGGAQVRLTNNAALDHNPDWSPDGSKIVFASDRDGDNEIWTMDPDGNGAMQLTSNTASDAYPSYSPDGTKILFHSDRDGDREIYSMNADGSGVPDNLTETPTHDDQLANWSAAGQKIVFQTNRDAGNVEIYTMDANGANQARLTNNSAVDDLADWQPLPAMAVTRYNPNGSLDTSFGTGGKQTVEYTGGAAAGDVAIQTNSFLAGTSKIVVAGSQYGNAGNLTPIPVDFAVARLEPNGSLDGSFGTGGRTTLSVSQRARALAIQHDGNIVSAGGVNSGSTFAITRQLGGQITIDASPSTGLTRAGQTIAVTATGLEPNTQHSIDQCRPAQCVQQGTFTSNGSGVVSTSVNVDETLDGSASNCPDPQCTVRIGPTGSTGQSISTQISFSRQSALELTPSAGQIGSLGESALVGQPITMTAVARGASSPGSPTGSVNFDSCGPVGTPQTCTESAGVDRGTKTLSSINASDSSATSDPITFATPGRYCFRAFYGGDVNYRRSSDASPAACINVRQPNAALQATDDYYKTPNNADLGPSTATGVLLNDLWPQGLIVGGDCNDTAHVCAVLDESTLHGGLTLNSDGSFTYNPDDGFSGTDDFKYLVQQGGGGQSTVARVTIDVSATADMLDGTRFRGTRFRGTRFRDIEQVTAVTYSQCRSRFVWLNPQITIPASVNLQVSAALYDAAGNRIAATDGYLANDPFYGDPFQPTVLTHLVWSQPVPSDGAFAEVYIVVEPGTVDEYEVTSSVLCGT